MDTKNKKTIDREERRTLGYYSTPSFIADFLAEEMFKLNPTGKRVLDPAVGQEELLSIFQEQEISTEGYDIKRYKRDYRCKFYHEDFLRLCIKNRDSLMRKEYDFIILNPPYINYKNIGSLEFKRFLNENFPKSYSNLFADFLTATIEIAKDGCIIGAVLPDSILYSKTYNPLRLKILEQCAITHIILCPESTFRGTSANLSACLLIMKKGKGSSKSIKVLDRLTSSEELKIKLTKRDFEERKLEELIVHNGEDSIISVSITDDIRFLISNSPKLGERFTVSGGVSSGRESEFISVEKKKGYSIPYYTNPASSKFLCEPNCWLRNDFMEVGKRTKGFIARNNHLYNREGIVCSATGKRYSACYLPKEGIVRTNASIFPPSKDLYWLLAYLNSSLVTYILKGILTRSNITTIGNVASIPIPDFPDHIKHSLSILTLSVVSGNLTTEDAIKEIDRVLEKHLILDDCTQKRIHQFCADITHLV